MKRLAIIILVLLLGFVSQAGKRLTLLNTLNWYAVDGKFTSVSDYLSVANNIKSLDISTFTIDNNSHLTIHTIIEAPSDSMEKLFLEMEHNFPFQKVLINGRTVTNLRQDSSLTAEITATDANEELLLTLVFDSQTTTVCTNLYSCLEGMYLSSITNIAVTWCEPLKDPFFGGYMLEIHVWNLLTKDIDGKLLARVTDSSTYDLVTENTNCAFTRSFSEAIIDINFPDAKDKLTKGPYNVEIVLVDKEKNEEIVDKLSVPVNLN